MLNVSPIGRNCSYEEREEFNRYDAVCASFRFRLYLCCDTLTVVLGTWNPSQVCGNSEEGVRGTEPALCDRWPDQF
jgi:hypothetical protein